MSLLEKASMFNIYLKNRKKSILQTVRLDLFLVISLFILIVTPIIVSLIMRLGTEITRVNLYLSPRCGEILGAEVTENLLLQYREQNPDIGIRVMDFSSDYSQVIGIDERGREPDILIFDENDYRELIASGALLELNSYTNYEEGAQYAFPLVSFMDVLFYNIDLLSAAGFDRPPKTREEYRAYARAAMNNGFYSDNVINDEIWNELPYTDSEKLEEFTQGKIAMMAASTRAIPYFREIMGDEAFSITDMPFASDGSGERSSLNFTGIYAGININCEKPDEAWRFIDFLIEQRPVFCEIFKAVPGISDVIPGSYVKDDPFYSKAWDIYEYNRIVKVYLKNQ